MGAGASYRKLIPFVTPEENVTPGVATWYASACRECPAGCGVLLRNREAHIVKAEGNPRHAINAGRLCARGQASLQGLYDPDRASKPLRSAGGRWEEPGGDGAIAQVGVALAGAKRVGVITDLQSGSLADLVRRWVTALRGKPDDILVYEPFNYEPLRVANQAVFGRPEIPDYRIDRADFLVSFGADFLETWISPVQFSQRFVKMRQVQGGKRSRFIYVGPRRSPTAAQADKHLLVPPGKERLVALAVLRELGGKVPTEFTVANVAKELGLRASDIQEIADGFRRARAPLALGGDPLPAGAEANAMATTVQMLNLARPSDAMDFSRVHALGTTATAAETVAFFQRVAAGEFDALVVLGANPVYSLPPDVKAAEALSKVKTLVCLNSFKDETVALHESLDTQGTTWALPINAPAESWGDYSPATGIYTLQQPAMGTYFDSRDAGDVLMALAEAAGVSLPAAFRAGTWYDFLRNRWQALHRASGSTGTFEAFWRKSVQNGGVAVAPGVCGRVGERGSGRAGDVTAGRLGHAATNALNQYARQFPGGGGTRLYIHPSLHLFDGRHANKRWLQEVPDPMTKAVWGSWVELNPQTARSLGVATGDLVELAAAGSKCEVPAHVWEGVAPGAAILATGQGHTSYGRYANGFGVNAFSLLKHDGSGVDYVDSDDVPRGSVQIRKLEKAGDHVVTHGEHDQHEREIVMTVALADLAGAEPEKLDLPTPEGFHKAHDVYPSHEHPNHRWAMAVDLDRCTGCNACVVACYAENNIAVTDDKDQVRRKHELPWLRIDRYEEKGRSLFQPMMCQQCDSAPCEPVCPAYATTHSPDGLNEQIYNRCVGTRYCSNNCPYKARRFNWFHYEWPEPLNFQLNPDVTVRDRGVMEKCTFCVQRIKEVTIRAKAEGRQVQDGDITPACVQTCPADVFVFGDLKDPNSRISRLVAEDPRRYQVLRELNTKPAVFYQKKIVEAET